MTKLSWLTPIQFGQTYEYAVEPRRKVFASSEEEEEGLGKTKHWKQGIMNRVSRMAYNRVRLLPGYESMTPEEREERAKDYDLRKMRR